jgi:hypothetical protein
MLALLDMVCTRITAMTAIMHGADAGRSIPFTFKDMMVRFMQSSQAVKG